MPRSARSSSKVAKVRSNSPSLFDVEIKVLVVRVVIGMRDLDEGDAGFEQAAGQQAVPAEIVMAVAFAQLWPVRGSGRNACLAP